MAVKEGRTQFDESITFAIDGEDKVALERLFKDDGREMSSGIRWVLKRFITEREAK